MSIVHTIGEYGYAVSLIFTCVLIIAASIIAGYAMLALALADEVVITSGRGVAVIGKHEVSVNWSVPCVLLFGATLWVLIALGFHALV